jgi:hypothetical protein
MLGSELIPLTNLKKEYLEKMNQKPYSTMRKALYQQFNGGRTSVNQEIDLFVLASISAENRYKEEMDKNPKKVLELWLHEERKRVKPISCEEKVTITSQPQVRPKPVTQPSKTVLDSTPVGLNQKQEERPIQTDQPPSFNTISLYPQFRGLESYDTLKFKTDAPKRTGEYFKVQIEITSPYQKSKYANLSQYGRIDSEWLLPDFKKNRALVGDFDTYEKAVPVAKKVQNAGFNNVAIVRYKDGNRFESRYRDWKVLPD